MGSNGRVHWLRDSNGGREGPLVWLRAAGVVVQSTLGSPGGGKRWVGGCVCVFECCRGIVPTQTRVAELTVRV